MANKTAATNSKEQKKLINELSEKLLDIPGYYNNHIFDFPKCTFDEYGYEITYKATLKAFKKLLKTFECTRRNRYILGSLYLLIKVCIRKINYDIDP